MRATLIFLSLGLGSMAALHGCVAPGAKKPAPVVMEMKGAAPKVIDHRVFSRSYASGIPDPELVELIEAKPKAVDHRLFSRAGPRDITPEATKSPVARP